eukprot:COSAG05_NODE_4283_length_1584_cov_1.761616_2_plen_100_part_00
MSRPATTTHNLSVREGLDITGNSGLLEVDLQVVSGQLRICGAAPDRDARTDEHLNHCHRLPQIGALLAVRNGIVALTSNTEPTVRAVMHRVQVTYYYNS